MFIHITVEGLHPFNLQDTHEGFSLIPQIVYASWARTPSNYVSIEAARWVPVLCAFVFFAFFGFADEARKHYRLAFDWVAKQVGLSGGNRTELR